MIKRIVLENWRTHRHSELVFGKGTNVLVGVMGSGKSTVVEAMCYALFGTFPALQARKLNAAEVIMNKPAKMDHAKVRIEFSYAQKEYELERTLFRSEKASQANLWANGRLIAGPGMNLVTEAVEKELEMNYELFSRAVYSEQNQIDFFLRLNPGDRKEKFDELLELKKYETARAGAVKLGNKLRDSLKERKGFLEMLSKGFREEDLSNLEQRLAEMEMLEIRAKKKREELLKELAEKENALKELDKKEQEHKLFEEIVLKARARAEQLEKEINSLKKRSGKAASKKKEEIGKILKELEQELREIEKMEKKLAEKKAEADSAKEKISLLEEEKERKRKMLREKSAKEIKELIESEKVQEKKLVEEILGAEKSAKELAAKASAMQSMMEESKRIVLQLEKMEAKCPVCRKELEKKKRENLLEEKRREMLEFLEKLGIFKESAKEGEKKVQELRTEREKCTESKRLAENAFEAAKEIASYDEKICGFMEKARKNASEADEIEKMLEKENRQAFEEQKEEAENTLEMLEKETERKDLLEEAGKAEKKMKELDFEEEKVRKKREEIVQKKAEAEATEKELSNNRERKNETGQEIKKMQEAQQRLKSLEAEAAETEKVLEALSIFTNILAETQAQMREKLIDNINQAMEDIWPRLYPYKDYVSAKIQIAEGNYEVIVKSRAGEWTRVEGILSGGERSAAAITIRIAISLVLAQNTSWLILDEPTHNLDPSGVAALSGLMKEHLPELVEQIFLITHDKEMEKAASSTLYVLERSKDLDGITLVRQEEIE